jgi:hypothetical protein
MSEDNKTPTPGTAEEDLDLSALIEKVIDLQDSLVQSQEKNIVLSAQTRELEQVARDADDMKAELAAQSLLLADKSRENKHLHQELSRVTSLLDTKLIELEELRVLVIDLQQQVRAREAERDRLAVMLNEAEKAQRLAEEEALVARDQTANKGWFSGKGKKQ